MAPDHLSPSAAAALALPAGERIRWLRQPRWIGYTRSQQVLEKLEALLDHPCHHRMPNLLLVAQTNNGKTTIVNRFVHLHKREANETGESSCVPVLLVEAPPAPDEARFYTSLLESLAAPYNPHEPVARKHVQVLRLLRAVGVRMLIIDEIHHILAGHHAKQRQFLNVLKYLGNQLQISLVGVGTPDALRAIETDPQLANRFEPFTLPRWELNREFQMLLASFERILPLPRPSCLADERLATRLLALSEGTIGEISALLMAAATHAIHNEQERIDECVVAALDWTAPSERRRRAEQIL